MITFRLRVIVATEQSLVFLAWGLLHSGPRILVVISRLVRVCTHVSTFRHSAIDKRSKIDQSSKIPNLSRLEFGDDGSFLLHRTPAKYSRLL